MRRCGAFDMSLAGRGLLGSLRSLGAGGRAVNGPSGACLTIRAAAEPSTQSTDSQQSLGGPGSPIARGETTPPRKVRLRARLSPHAVARGHIACERHVERAAA